MEAKTPLFDGERFRVVLWHEQQERVVLEGSKDMSDEEMEKANQYYVDRLCPDLEYRRRSDG